ncbi:MAG: SulP family inorganic anion transporter [Polyangiaceae bacterium]|jgi:MFS superfamily sulfate permease-like transporter|nr:SulP family inorganic anion transporter [Polyangiaceae bacterium]
MSLPVVSRSLFASLKSDLPAGLVVFLVAVPLCLGIAQASGAPLLSGLIAGIVAGLVVTLASASPLSVSGPAAGLTVIVATGIKELGLRPFLMSVVLAGGLQVVMGLLRLGGIAHFFPSPVIKGMLAAIGMLIVLKQVPHAVGYDATPEGNLALVQPDGSTTFGALLDMIDHLSPGAMLISLLCTGIMLVWPLLQRGAMTRLVPPALLVVVGGGVVATLLNGWWPGLLASRHIVRLPLFDSAMAVLAAVISPDFTHVADPAVWRVAVTLALVASLETLLSLEAVDRLDPYRRISPPNRELLAQGLGNVVSGLLGGLPVTSVIVRSSANVQAGGQTRLAAFLHGLLLLVGLLFLAPLFNRVPLASLAVVLIFVGLRLTPWVLWRQMWKAGASRFVPFGATVVAILLTDLLKGTVLGLFVGLFFMIRRQQENAIVVEEREGRRVLRFLKDVTFLQKGRLKEILRTTPTDRPLLIDRRVVDHVDDDIEEILDEYCAEAGRRGVAVEICFEEGGEARREARLARGA